MHCPLTGEMIFHYLPMIFHFDLYVSLFDCETICIGLFAPGGLAEEVDDKVVHAALLPFGEIIDIQIPLDYETGLFFIGLRTQSVIFRELQ